MPTGNLLARNPNHVQPRRDIVVTDGMKLTLGDTTLTLYLTPGHTPGTISTLIPVKDNGRPHLMAEWGGSGFNFTITPERQRDYWFKSYIASAQRFREAAQKAADGMIANHPRLDGSNRKFPMLAVRKPGDAHPYVTGTEGVMRYLTVAEECAKVGSRHSKGASVPGPRKQTDPQSHRQVTWNRRTSFNEKLGSTKAIMKLVSRGVGPNPRPNLSRA